MSHLIHAREADARLVLGIRAVEETDPEGQLLSRQALQRASATAREGVGEATSTPAGWRYLVLRARALTPPLGDSLPGISGDSVWRRWLPPLVLGLALALGLATAILGPERRINLLSLPLFGILAWNLGLYLVLFLGFLFRRRFTLPALPRFPTLRRSGDPAHRGARTRFAQLWIAAAAPLEHHRLRRLLHAAALVLAVGVLAGMYVRGLAFAYQVTWESTFLKADQVQGLMDITLGPAAALLGWEVRPVALLEAPGAEPAGPWIHLFAVTLLLGVGLPRLLLVVWESGRILRLRRRLPIDLGAAYFRRRLAEGRGEAERVVVAPYSFQPSTAARDALRELLGELLGSRASIQWREPLEYGEELEASTPGTSEREPEDHLLPLFPLAQTPEAEVHGAWLQQLAAEREPARRWAVVDEGGFPGAEERREGRRRSWRRVCREAGFAVLIADLATAPADELYRRLEAVLEAVGSAPRGKE